MAHLLGYVGYEEGGTLTKKVRKKPYSIILFDDEDVTKTLVESYLTEITFPYRFEHYKEFDISLIPSDNRKKIIIVNINKTIIKNIDILEKIGHNMNNKIVIISYDKSADVQVKALRNGAKDFLFKPLIKSEFLNSLQKIYYKDINTEDKNMSSKVYSVISLVKGVGKTFFTLNLAEQLAKITNEKVLLVDFNNNLTDIFQILNKTVFYTTVQYVNELSDENAPQMLGKLEKYGKVPLYILGTGMCSYNQKINEVKVSEFFNVLKKHFKYILIDNDSTMGRDDEIIMNNADYVYMIIEPSVAMAEFADNRALNMKLRNKIVRVILNKYKEQKDDPVLPKLENLMGREIFAKIPKNYIAANKAFDKGLTVDEINPELDIVKEYVKLAKYIIERDK